MPNQQPACIDDKAEKQEILKQTNKEAAKNYALWTDGLICAFELVQGQKQESNTNGGVRIHDKNIRVFSECNWVPIGWSRISELIQRVKVDETYILQQINFMDGDDSAAIADVATPYWEQPDGPTWWCHVDANHPSVISWLTNEQWLYPAISIALRDESRLISERMKYLFYEVPVRVGGGLLFELLGQSVGDPFFGEDDTPIVLRSWQAKNFLITCLHIKGSATNINVLGITEVQELLLVGGSLSPKTIHEVIAHLVLRLSQWDNRLFRKYVFGAADEIELKFVNRGNYEDMSLLCLILNQDIRNLATQVIKVKWSLHARDEIIFEMLHHLRGSVTRDLLEAVKKSTREMLEEQEAVRGRLFTIQDVMQNTVRAWLQDKSVRITHNLAIIGGCGLVLSIITGLFGINVDGIPGSQNTPYAFGVFAGILFFIGFLLVGLGMLYLGMEKPINEAKVNVRKMELDELVSTFQRDVETHGKVRQNISRQNLPPTAAGLISKADFIMID